MHHLSTTFLLLFMIVLIASCSTGRKTNPPSYESSQEKFLPLMLDVELDTSSNPSSKNSVISAGINAKGLDVYIDVQNANYVDIELTSVQINVEKSQIKMPLNQILPSWQINTTSVFHQYKSNTLFI